MASRSRDRDTGPGLRPPPRRHLFAEPEVGGVRRRPRAGSLRTVVLAWCPRRHHVLPALLVTVLVGTYPPTHALEVLRFLLSGEGRRDAVIADYLRARRPIPTPILHDALARPGPSRDRLLEAIAASQPDAGSGALALELARRPDAEPRARALAAVAAARAGLGARPTLEVLNDVDVFVLSIFFF